MRRFALAACLPLLALALVVGCSKAGGKGVASANGSAQPGATPTGSVADQARRHAQCMRERGVPEADPIVEPNGDVHMGGGYDKHDLDQDVLDQAFEACKQYLPVLTGTLGAMKRQGALELAQCMRAHGVENFPDPDEHLQFDTRAVENDPEYEDAWQYCRGHKESPTPTVTK